jgi:hypothetical protein
MWESHVMRGAHLFILSIDMQACLELAVAVWRNGIKFSQCSMHGEAFHKLGVQDIIKFDSG